MVETGDVQLSGPPILFISHQASRTGAPRVLLCFLTWLRDHTDLSFEILLLRDGPLQAEFRAIAPVTVLTDLPFGPILPRVEVELANTGHSIGAAAIREVLRFRMRHLRRFRTVYLNSIACVPALRYLPSPPEIIIAHVHELATGIHTALSDRALAPLSDADRRRPLRSVDLFIAAADCVASDLVNEMDVPQALIRRHYEFIDVHHAMAAPDRRLALRNELGIGPRTMVIVGSGSFEWRKGPDLFIQLARTVFGRRPNADLCFAWVGGEIDGPTRWPLEHDIRHLGLDGRIRFVGNRPNPLDYFYLADVFALTSRDDPFPLVCLEASLLEKPVVSFDNGGMREFLSDGCGFVVPYLDVEAMAGHVIALLDDPLLARKVGKRAAARVRSDHDVLKCAPRLLEDIRHAARKAGR